MNTTIPLLTTTTLAPFTLPAWIINGTAVTEDLHPGTLVLLSVYLGFAGLLLVASGCVVCRFRLKDGAS